MNAPELFRSRFYFVFCWSLFVLWFITLNFLSSMPSPSAPPAFRFPNADKVVHFLIFFTGALTLATAWSAGRSRLRKHRFLLTFLLLAMLGIADEFRQLLIPGRSGADLGDMLANASGALVGSASSFIVHLRFNHVFFRN